MNTVEPLAAPEVAILTKIRDTLKPCESSSMEKIRFFNVLYEKKLPSDTTIEEFTDGLYLDILSVLVSLAESWCTFLLRSAEGQLMAISETPSITSNKSGDEPMHTLRKTSLYMINGMLEIKPSAKAQNYGSFH